MHNDVQEYAGFSEGVVEYAIDDSILAKAEKAESKYLYGWSLGRFFRMLPKSRYGGHKTKNRKTLNKFYKF